MATQSAAPAPSGGAAMSSRVAVKQLPPYLTEQRLRELFSAKGEVTDVKIMRTKDGRSRCFGFVGFKGPEAASAAQRYFDRSFVDTTRIRVEIARPVGARDLDRPWSRHSKGSSAYDKTHNEKATDRKAQRDGKSAPAKSDAAQASAELDAKLQEFLAVVQPRRTAKTWANDDGTAAPAQRPQHASSAAAGVSEEKNDGTTEAPAFEDAGSDDEMYEALPAASRADASPSGEEGGEEAGSDGPAPAARAAWSGMSDLEYLRSKTTAALRAEEDEAAEDEDEDLSDTSSVSDPSDGEEAASESEGGEGSDSDENSHGAGARARDGGEDGAAAGTKTAQEAAGEESEEDAVTETGRLFVRNLPYSVTEEELKSAFSQYGPIAEIHLPVDDAKRPKGFAYVLFMFPAHAVQAMAALDGQIFQGRLMHVLPARDKPVPPLPVDEDGAGEGAGSSYKAKKEAGRREQAGNDVNWNPLFVNQATVVEAVAARLGVSKGELLDMQSTGGSMAVQVALAETEVLADVKRMLEREGVELAVLQRAGRGEKVARSSTVLLAKNLPFATQERELHELFGKFGAVARLVLPETRALALVELSDAAEARRALRGLAYKKFKHAPLYLEFAPEGVFSTPPPARAAAAPASAPADATAAVPAEPAAPEGAASGKQGKVARSDAAPPAAEEEDEGAESSTLFVKNLNFGTTEEALQRLFAQCEGVRAVSIAKKRNPKDKSASMSMGFGFVEFKSEELAKRAMKRLQGAELDGHALSLKFSAKKLGASAAAAGTAARKRSREQDTSAQPKGAAGSKVTVKNVPFEATRTELRELFGTYGQLKSLRLPRKFDGGHRGFAFVEFLTRQEAKNAFDALSSTHLYGRRLVVEWANPDDDVDALREKAERDVRRTEGSAPKRARHGRDDGLSMPGEVWEA